MRRLLLSSLLVAILVVLAFLVNYVLFGGQQLRTDFYYMAWLPGRGMIEGKDPYLPPYSLLYPPWTLILSLPFVLLPAPAALASWALASECAAMGFLTTTLRALDWRLRPGRFALVVFLALIFRPSLATILHGQYQFVTLLFVGLTLFALRTERYLLAGLCLALSMIKPQLVFLLIPALLAWVMVHRQWRTVASFLLTTVGLVALSQAFVPSWLPSWLMLASEQQLQYRTFMVPSIWGLAHSLAASHWVALASALSLLLLLALGCIWWRYRHSKAHLPLLVSATIIVTQIVTPKIWSYDQVMLLLPLLYCLYEVVRPRRIGTLCKELWIAVLVGWLIMLPYLLGRWAMVNHSEIPFALMPITLGVILLSIEAMDRSSKD